MKRGATINIVYYIVIVILILLTLIAIAEKAWTHFFIWIVLITVFVFGAFVTSGHLKFLKAKKKPKKEVKKKKPKKKPSPRKKGKLMEGIRKKIIAFRKKATTKEKKMSISVRTPKKEKKPSPAKEKKKLIVEEKAEEFLPRPIIKKKPKLKIIELKKPEKKFETKARKVETEFDQLIKEVKQKKEMSFKEVENKFGLTREKVEDWAKLLESHGLLEIKYPTFGEPKLVIKKKEDGKGI